jgi:hypothetical protein
MFKLFVYILLKKMGLCNPSSEIIQARHQFFDWKLETRRRKNSPSAPLALERSKKLIIGSS